MTEFDKKWLLHTYRSGKTNSITGDKGGGKSHSAVWFMYLLRNLGFEIYTNILFKKCVENNNGRKKFVEAYPPHIHKVNTLVDLLKEICKQLQKNPFQPSVFFWDELQNSLSAYDWNTELFRAIIKFLSITRKFGLDNPDSNIPGGLCVVVMSPSFYRGIPAGIREELDVAFLKDEEIYDIFINLFPDGRLYDPKEIMFYKKGKRNILNDRNIGEVFEVGTCKLCDEKNCDVGDIVYAQKGFSFIEFGNFDNNKKMGLKDFQDFLSYTSKVIPDELPDAVLEYLKGKFYELKCEICGGTFKAQRSDAKYCSKSCTNKAYWRKKTKKTKYK